MRIGISGGSGLLGKKLVIDLSNDKHEIVVFSRGKKLPDEFKGNNLISLVTTNLPTTNELTNLDILINLAGEPVVGKRWTEEVKANLSNSRIDYTKGLINNLSLLIKKPKLFINASAIGYYGFTNGSEPIFSEDSNPGNDFLAILCADWEREALVAQRLGIRTAIIRIGVVFSKQGGALEQMLPPFKAFVGGPIGSGKQYLSWIHINDIVGAIKFICQNERISGPINLTSPNPVSNETLSNTIGKVLGRPTFIRVPELAIALMFGEGAGVVTKGQNVIPKKLLDNGFIFQFTDLEKALVDIVNV